MENPDTNALEICNVINHCNAINNIFTCKLLFRRSLCMLYLMRQSAISPLTYPRLVKLLQPCFSDKGSNSRIEEERAYRYFLKYIKEVTGMCCINVSLIYIVVYNRLDVNIIFNSVCCVAI